MSKSRTDLNKGRAESGRLGQPSSNSDTGDKYDASEFKLQFELNEQVREFSFFNVCWLMDSVINPYILGIQNIKKKSRRSGKVQFETSKRFTKGRG